MSLKNLQDIKTDHGVQYTLSCNNAIINALMIVINVHVYCIMLMYLKSHFLVTAH